MGAMLKLYESRSKYTVKVTCLKSIVPLERYGHKKHINYAKYERPVSYSKKVKANVQKYVKDYGQGHTLKICVTIEKGLS